MGSALPLLLLVDDDAVAARACARLWSRSWRVLVARCDDPMSDAMELARTEGLALALVDLYLPKPIGLDLVEQIKAERPNLYTVLVSSSMSLDWAHRASVADDVIPKPFTLDEVVQRKERGSRDARLLAHQTETLADAQHHHVRRVLAECSGNLTRAPRLLGISRNRLGRLLDR